MNKTLKWPPLNCLRGFQAAARLGSFSRAAEALHMTQSAVSHQIKTLENYLGQPLFIRVNRKVILADAGIDLLATTDECLDLLDNGFKRLEQFKKPNQVIVHTSSAFASHWLLPRLGEYRRQPSPADIWLYTTDDRPDLELTEVHLAIVYGAGHWPSLAGTQILDDTLVPLCAPGHPIMRQGDREPNDLLQHDLLHGELRENWNSWFRRFGRADHNPTSGPNFSSPGLLLEAAQQGQGIALGSLTLAAQSLRNGSLASPLYLGIRAPQQYHLLTRLDAPQSPLLQSFANWLIDAARRFHRHDYQVLLANYDVR